MGKLLVLNKVIGKTLADKVIFEQRLAGDKRAKLNAPG